MRTDAFIALRVAMTTAGSSPTRLRLALGYGQRCGESRDQALDHQIPGRLARCIHDAGVLDFKDPWVLGSVEVAEVGRDCRRLVHALLEREAHDGEQHAVHRPRGLLDAA